jgi:hypothetical protein
MRVAEAAVFVLPPLDLSPLALLLDVPAALLAVCATLLLAWRRAGALWERRSRRAAAAH